MAEATRHFLYLFLLNQEKDRQKEIENQLHFNARFFQKLQALQQQKTILQTLFLKWLQKRNYKAYLEWKKRLKRKHRLNYKALQEEYENEKDYTKVNKNGKSNTNTNINLRSKPLYSSEMLWQKNLYMRQAREDLRRAGEDLKSSAVSRNGYDKNGYRNCSRKAFKVSP
jgi:hypothetical protein